MEQNKSKKDLILNEVISLLKIAVFSFVFVYIMQAFFFKPIHVDGNSMYPTLHDNDMGFTNVFSRNTSGLKRFDIVIVYIPERDKYLVKRIIGLPGETISYSENKLFINGEYVEEKFFNEEYVNEYMKNIDGYFTSDMQSITLKENEYFLMGDNRRDSSDSRFYGPFQGSQIIGKNVIILYPFNHIQIK